MEPTTRVMAMFGIGPIGLPIAINPIQAGYLLVESVALTHKEFVQAGGVALGSLQTEIRH